MRIERKKFIQHGGGKRRAERFPARLRKRARDGCKLGREAARRRADVDADAEDGIAQTAVFKVERALGEDAADLFAVHIHIVDPLNLRRDGCHTLDGVRNGDSGCRGDEQRIAHGKLRAQQNAHIQPCARRGQKGLAAPPAPRRLRGGNDHRSLGRTIFGEAAHAGIGGIGIFQRGDGKPRRAQTRRDGCCRQPAAVGAQRVTAARHGVDGIAIVPQGADRLPHGGAADARLFRHLRAGYCRAVRLRQALQYRFFRRHAVYLTESELFSGGAPAAWQVPS